MALVRKRGKLKIKRVLFAFLLILLLFNAENIGRFFFPFPYRQAIFSEAADVGVDGYLLAAIIKTESNFNPRAVSVKGARGLMQVMPETGRWVAGQKGIKNYTPDMLFDPDTNIKIGAYYISNLYGENNGNIAVVLASYNAGRGNVKKWIEQGIWNGERGNVDQIPFPETRQFVRKVLFYQQGYRNFYGRFQDLKKNQ